MNFQIVEKLDSGFIEQIKELFTHTWWTKNRDLESIEKMLYGSLCIGVKDSSQRLVGFARAITDGIFKAVVVDVIVVPDHRGEGVCKLLMNTLLAHETLSQVSDIELYCQPELINLYKKWGFHESPNGVVFMRASRAV